MVILLCHTSAFSELIYADFYAKSLDWNFRLVDENSRILVVVFVSKLNFSSSFRFVDENYRIFVVVVFVTKINLLSSTKIFVFIVVDKINTGYKLCKFCDNRASDVPLRGTYISHFDQISVKISVLGSYTLPLHRLGWNLAWTTEPLVPLLHSKFHPHPCNVSPLWGEKPQNRPEYNLNTGALIDGYLESPFPTACLL